MTTMFPVPDLVRRRAEHGGSEGLAWLAELDGVVESLAARWDIEVGTVLNGGSEALVAEITRASGEPAILKIGLPGSESGRGEAAVLQLAEGRGYVRLFEHDAEQRAMLLERLGRPISDSGLPLQDELRILCETLRTAWMPVPPGASFMNGAEKAVWLANFIVERWEAEGRPCSERTVDRALVFAGRRRDSFSPKSAVLAHGDGHGWNALDVPGTEPRAFKFIDPDGLIVEREHDLGILLRGWGASLLAGDPIALGHERARYLAGLTGADPVAAWEWGFMERVSTGLVLKRLGVAEAAEYLAVADAWAFDTTGP